MIAHDVVQGVVYERNGVKVTAFDVDHGAPKMPAFGYRIDCAGRSVVISGDTRPSDNLVRFAEGTDVLIHEVMAARPEAISRSEILRRTAGSHTSPEEAGRVFERVKPRLAVYKHIGLMAAAPSAITGLAESLIPRTRTIYAGPLEVGEDLMTIEIGDRVEVRRSPTGADRDATIKRLETELRKRDQRHVEHWSVAPESQPRRKSICCTRTPQPHYSEWAR